MTRAFFKTVQILVILNLVVAVGCKKDKESTSNTESPNFVTFSNGRIPSSWQTTAWTIDNTVGFDDLYSLKATEDKVAVVTNKIFEVPSYVEFYTIGYNFHFYIDGIKANPIGSSNIGNWRQWIYAISQGSHVFKWETSSVDKLNLDAIKFAPSDLPPDVYTIDVTQQGRHSVIVNYFLSNSGNSLITTHGICWSTMPNPTISDNKTINTESSIGSYTSVIEKLEHNTTYYVRAYASNIVDVGYGKELSITTSKSFIGDHHQGGIVAYVDATGEHGLIAATEEQSTSIQWGGYGISTGAIGTEIGTGKSNTTKIIQTLGAGNYAAKLCDDLVLNGYNDWFLPSIDELNILYQNRNLIEGFTGGIYWSSSEFQEYNTNTAWGQNFSTYGGRIIADKNHTYKVRAVRYF
jgi:hypothetical protein